VYWIQGRAGGSFLRPVFDLLQEPGVRVARYWDEDPQPFRGSNPHVPWIVHYVPGRRALISLANYTGRTQTIGTLHPDRMGFEGAVTIRDAETLQPYHLGPDNTLIVRFPRKHDVGMLEVLP
jgi:hypothetical protein